MTTRILPREEYGRLQGTELEDVWKTLPLNATIVVVERAGQIVGCHALFAVVHVEGLWKAATAGAGVSRALWAAVQRTAREQWGTHAVMTTAVDDRVRQLLAHVGATKVPGDSYMVPVKG